MAKEDIKIISEVSYHSWIKNGLWFDIWVMNLSPSLDEKIETPTDKFKNSWVIREQLLTVKYKL